uniref:Uncharacterized protein n=1 Tax=Zea mays TaxID=4577 RepID=C4J372_MAIZE|nr:unknown [Zea mays]
MLPWKLSSRS